MERMITDQVRVEPDIAAINRLLNRAQQVAVSEMSPLYTREEGKKVLSAFQLKLEGPPTHISNFLRLIANANLKIS